MVPPRARFQDATVLHREPFVPNPAVVKAAVESTRSAFMATAFRFQVEHAMRQMVDDDCEGDGVLGR